jgi:tRNA threonylcarbamoyladenosine biosynthesis protein TsaB
MNPETLILLINTAFSEASIALARNGELVDELTNTVQLDHAAFVHPAVQQLCKKNGLHLSDCSAVAVMNGPGSYTGLRVGLSSAKGICYALQKPLLCINTLEWMAFGNRQQGADCICPMIDARRMEVFRAIYDLNMNMILEPGAAILEAESFGQLLQKNSIAFVGDGAEKWKKICQSKHAFFPEPQHNTTDFAQLAQDYFAKKRVADLATVEPFYTKAFYSTMANRL